MSKIGCVLELMVGMLWLGEQKEEEGPQKDQLEELIKLGFSNYQTGQDAQAIKYFKQALSIRERADIYNNIGVIQINKGEYGKAVNSFKKALNLNISYIPAFYNLGLTMYYARAYDNAIDIFGDLVKAKGLMPKMLVSAHNDLGCAYKRKGKVENAIQHFEMAITLDKSFDRPYVNLGNIYCEQGKWDEAKEKYEKALSVNPNCAAAINGLGVLAFEKGDFDQAKTLFDKAFVLDKQCQAAYINKMIVEKKLKEIG